MRKAKTKKKARIAWSKGEIRLLKRLLPHSRAEEVESFTGVPFALKRRTLRNIVTFVFSLFISYSAVLGLINFLKNF